MKKNALFLVAAVLLSMSLVMVTGCGDDDDETIATPTFVDKPFVSAMVGMGGGHRADDNTEAMVMVTNFTNVPGVTINGHEMGVEPEFSFYGEGSIPLLAHPKSGLHFTYRT